MNTTMTRSAEQNIQVGSPEVNVIGLGQMFVQNLLTLRKILNNLAHDTKCL